MIQYILGFSDKAVLEDVEEIFELSDDDVECEKIANELIDEIRTDFKRIFNLENC